jgi:hypothetical protein
MEAREDVGVVGEFESIFRAFREGVCDCVGPIMSWHEFGNSCFAFAFVIAVAIFGREHYKVINLIHILWHLVLIGMVCLVNFGSKEVVLCFLNIGVDMCNDVMCSDLLSSDIFGEWHYRRDDTWRLASFELETRETGGCIHSVHDGKPYMGEFG